MGPPDFRVSDAEQRQQTKWIVYGTTFAMVGLIGRYLLPELVTITQPYHDLLFLPFTRLLQLLLPLTLAFAIFRYRQCKRPVTRRCRSKTLIASR